MFERRTMGVSLGPCATPQPGMLIVAGTAIGQHEKGKATASSRSWTQATNCLSGISHRALRRRSLARRTAAPSPDTGRKERRKRRDIYDGRGVDFMRGPGPAATCLEVG